MQRIYINNKWLPYLLILPTSILILVFKIYPIFDSIYTSFTSSKVDGLTLNNYIVLFQDKTFWTSFWVTIKMNVIMIPLQIIIAFIMALLVNVHIKGITIFRTIFYLPFCVSLSLSTVIWQMLLNVNDGVANSILSIFGISRVGFLIDKRYALLAIILICSWRGCAYWMMFFLAGLKAIDTEIYEAAAIDGASFFQRLFRVTIPLMKNTFLFVLVANTTANFLLFAPVQIATEGGPQNSTDVLMYEAYKAAFQYSNRPRSCCIVVVILIIVGAICIIQNRFLGKED